VVDAAKQIDRVINSTHESWLESYGAQLFAASFLALFLELMFIRWVPSIIQMVGYYANLMLISSFLGLGIGALLSTRGMRLFHWFPLLLLGFVGFFLFCREALLPGSAIELRFFDNDPKLLGYCVLIGIFIINTTVFIPIGERIGRLFVKIPPLHAYAWDLGGSLCGTVSFGIFSYFSFSPVLGVSFVILIYLLICEKRHRLWSIGAFLLVLVLIIATGDKGASWSPYHYLTVHKYNDSSRQNITSPAPDLHKMIDPPFYKISVNQNFYQLHGTIERSRYRPNSNLARLVEFMRAQYLLPYRLKPNPRKVAVVGAGGGVDVEAALLAGAGEVDAVEIDPKIVELSDRYNASRVYKDSRVNVHIDDARAFLHRTSKQYDAIVFSYLDSQALSSSMSNIRLDGFVYTVESVRTAFERLNNDGMLSLSFTIAGRPWLVNKLSEMVEQATGKEPIVYLSNLNVIICAHRGKPANVPTQIDNYRRIFLYDKEIPLATDDWPYLYLSKKSIPEDYLIVIGFLLVTALLCLSLLKRKTTGFGDLHFLFLGFGFLLLQTKSIIDCSLYFGATWLVTLLVITGILLMVLLANFCALRIKTFNISFYVGLLGSLLVLILVPGETILALPFIYRLIWTLLIIPLPIFFAGLIFSTTFRESQSPSSSFGANLIGATLGGFCEYFGMAIGYQALSLLVIVAYLASLLCVFRSPILTRSGSTSGLQNIQPLVDKRGITP
jgi:hypothetical protein